MPVQPVGICPAQSGVRQIRACAHRAEEYGLGPKVIARHGAAETEAFFDVGRKRSRADLLAMAIDASVGGIDTLPGRRQSARCRRENPSRVLVRNRPHLPKREAGVDDESKP